MQSKDGHLRHQRQQQKHPSLLQWEMIRFELSTKSVDVVMLYRLACLVIQPLPTMQKYSPSITFTLVTHDCILGCHGNRNSSSHIGQFGSQTCVPKINIGCLSLPRCIEKYKFQKVKVFNFRDSAWQSFLNKEHSSARFCCLLLEMGRFCKFGWMESKHDSSRCYSCWTIGWNDV